MTSETETATRQRPVTVRAVNGRGPRCGCGGQSSLHISIAPEITPTTSQFLCNDCILEALGSILVLHPDRPPYWPGDEGRDAPYERPAAVA